MPDIITLTGRVGTEPTFVTTNEGLMVSSFRLVSNPRWFDRKKEIWVDGSANWYTVKSFRQLAENVHHSVHKSDLVVVTGRLRVQEWESGDRKGRTVEVEANSVGHDLARGRTTFTPTARNSAENVPTGATAGSGENAWATLSGSVASREAAATETGPGNDRPADYASNLQQPFLPEERSDTIAS